MSLYYDRQGQPLELLDWAKKVEDLEYKVVATNERNGITVKTVWSGLDWGYGDDGRGPLIFSTGVMRTEDLNGSLGLDLIAERFYASEQEALDGHREWVELYGGADVPGAV